MKELFDFIFKNFWHFIGFTFLFIVVLEEAREIVEIIVKRTGGKAQKMEIRCRKCDSTKLFTETKGNQTGIYCENCGAWIKWGTPDEVRLITHSKSIPLKELEAAIIKEIDIASSDFTGYQTYRSSRLVGNTFSDGLSRSLELIHQYLSK